MVAAMLLSDLILGKRNDGEVLNNPANGDIK